MYVQWLWITSLSQKEDGGRHIKDYPNKTETQQSKHQILLLFSIWVELSGLQGSQVGCLLMFCCLQQIKIFTCPGLYSICVACLHRHFIHGPGSHGPGIFNILGSLLKLRLHLHVFIQCHIRVSKEHIWDCFTLPVLSVSLSYVARCCALLLLITFPLLWPNTMTKATYKRNA